MVNFFRSILWLRFFFFSFTSTISPSTHTHTRPNEHIQTHNEAVGGRNSITSNATATKNDTNRFSIYRAAAHKCGAIEIVLKRDHGRRSHIKSQISIYTIIWANPFPRFILFFPSLCLAFFLSLSRSLSCLDSLTHNPFVMRMMLSLLRQPTATGDARWAMITVSAASTILVKTLNVISFKVLMITYQLRSIAHPFRR